MKINTKVAVALLGLVFIGTAVKAQSLDDAKKAINAEQYQKAKSMLKNLTVTEADKDENYFYLGWVYLIQDEVDSAKLWFNKGIAVNPKSSLNYVGLGAVARLDKDQAAMNNDFNQAISFVKKDSKPYVYIGKSYLLTQGTTTSISPADANAAIAILRKDSTLNPKDPEMFITLGNAYLSQLRNTEAYSSFSSALDVDPKSAAAKVALGVISKYANNFDDAESDFKAAIALDPNFGPAYREWAETDLRWALTDPKMAAKKAEGVDHYKKYLSLTDMSVESQMRYADFLIYAHDPADYQILQQVATNLSKSAGTNLKVYRYLAYAAYENKDYTNGLSAMNTWMTKADPKRIIPEDYLYLGHLQMATGQDSLGMMNLKKAYDLDSTQTDVLAEIAKSLYAQKKYKEAGDAYALYISKDKNASLTDLFKEGLAYYFGYDVKDPKADTTLLTKADSALSKVQQKATKPVADIALFRARVNDLKEKDRNNIQGYAKPFYENFIELNLAKTTPLDARTKSNMVEAYDYLGAYYEFKEKDETKAADNYSKALAIDPTNAQALAYQARHKK